jgi:hypothetical protein
MLGVALLLGLAASPDVIRIGAVVLFISRPRPVANLLAFWLGGMATGLVSAVLAVKLLRDFSHVLIRDVTAEFSTGPIQIVIGVLAMLTAAVNAVGLARQRALTPTGGSDRSPLTQRPGKSGAVSRLVARAQHVLAGGRPWVAFAAGLVQLPVPVEYLALLSIGAASGAAIGTQFCAAIAYTVGMFGIIEIPLVAYLVKPEQTEAITLSVSNWLRAHRRRVLCVLGGAVGIVMLASGMTSI